MQSTGLNRMAADISRFVAPRHAVAWSHKCQRYLPISCARPKTGKIDRKMFPGRDELELSLGVAPGRWRR
jgi:hypothetical protein